MPRKKASTSACPEAPVTLNLILKPDQTVRVGLASDNGTTIGRSLGAVLIDMDGVEYRTPFQKKGKGRKLKWATLARLMSLGLV